MLAIKVFTHYIQSLMQC